MANLDIPQEVIDASLESHIVKTRQCDELYCADDAEAKIQSNKQQFDDDFNKAITADILFVGQRMLLSFLIQIIYLL